MAPTPKKGGGNAKAKTAEDESTSLNSLLGAVEKGGDTGARRAVWLGIIVFAMLVRYCVGLGPYSGYNTPPKFGDFECQRHWMEIAYHLPPSDWYRPTPDNNLTWWGLDYPPLSGYWSHVWGAVAHEINSSWVELNTSRGLETLESKMFMRGTVLVSDLVIYIPAVVYFIKTFYSSQPWAQQTLALATFLLQPALIMVDHGHFQYNSVSLGFALFSATLICSSNDSVIKDVVGGMFYTLSLNYKQMSLYYALPFFFVLLGKALHSKTSWAQRIVRVLCIGVGVVATCVVLWWPWLTVEGLQTVLARIFPVGRGLYEDKVANIWCSISPVIKLKQLYSIPFLTKMCAITTLAFSLPKGIFCLTRPIPRVFVDTLFNIALAFYLFSYHVHEKSSLLPGLPASMIILSDPLRAFVFNLYSCFSMYPLLKFEGLSVPYAAVMVLFIAVSVPTLDPVFAMSSKPNLLKFALFLSLSGMVVLHLADALITPPPHLPDLFTLLITTYSCAHFCLLFALSWLPAAPLDPTRTATPAKQKKE